MLSMVFLKLPEKLFGLPIWRKFLISTPTHKEVKTYRIYDENKKLVSLFYADFHPRARKQWWRLDELHLNRQNNVENALMNATYFLMLQFYENPQQVNLR